MAYGAEPWVATVAVLLAAGVLVVEKIQDWRTPDPGTVEHVNQLYREGEIDRPELERRLDVILDPEADRIRRSVERVSGIGEATSFAIAAEFRSLDEVRRADTDRLTEIPNVGEERARAIRNHVWL